MSVCVPQPGESACGRALSSTSPTSCGSLMSLMSKMCMPSKPAGTSVPSQLRASVLGAFQARTSTSFHTTMSP